MTEYILTCNPHTNHAKDRAETLTGTLEDIAAHLIETNDKYGYTDLSSDYWPYVYWNEPRSFTLDDDERAPERPVYSTDAVQAIASEVWDEHTNHIRIETVTMAALRESGAIIKRLEERLDKERAQRDKLIIMASHEGNKQDSIASAGKVSTATVRNIKNSVTN